MAREYHIAAVGGSNDDEVSVDRADANRRSLSRVHGSKVRWAEP
jgi:hypothetical protein